MNGRSPGRDSGGRPIPDPSAVVTALPGVAESPPVPDELRTTDSAGTCFIARGREDNRPCEACLSERGVDAWVRLWAAARAWLSAADEDLMIRICRGRIDEAHLRLVLEEDGPFTKGQRGGLVVHPAQTQLRTLLAEVVKLESLCGLSPSDRGRLGVVEAGGGEDDIVARRTAPRRTGTVPVRSASRRRAVGSGQDQVD